jgi:hypothetical protein
MNPQIKQLWEQAAKTTQDNSWEEHTKFMERFAQLIVQECINIAQDRANFPGFPPNDVNHIIDEIKQHFGVTQ